jgi:hypothetical protein
LLFRHFEFDREVRYRSARAGITLKMSVSDNGSGGSRQWWLSVGRDNVLDVQFLFGEFLYVVGIEVDEGTKEQQ